MDTRRVLRRLAAVPRWLLGLAIIGLFVAIALLPQGREGLFGRLEAIAYDARLATTLGKGGDPQVVIVDIDEASLRQQGRWPWSRDKVSLLTRQIFDKHQARAIAFDVVFAERDRSGGADVLIGLALDELRAWGVLGVLILVITVAAWFTSRWVARPMARLSQQVDAISRGEVPAEAVRGAREIERLGTALTTMARQRAAFDEQRRVMLIGVSHDLRSPLTRIRVAADLLSEQAPLRDLIVRNVEHADAIIESFLSYVRTDAESVEDNVDLSAVAASAARLAGLPAAQVRIAPGATVRGNPTMLQRLLANLLDNAARHGAPPILLSLAIDRGARRAELTVEDHGCGIVDPKRMLQPFERGDASRAQGGAGLGLAIVARIAERHAGTLAIGAVDGGGTRVTVHLPLN